MAGRIRFLAALLALALALGCGGALAQEGGEGEVLKTGLLTCTNVSAEELDADVAEQYAKRGIAAPNRIKHEYFNTLSSMLLALQAGQIYRFIIPTAVADYIIASNDSLTIGSNPPPYNALSMAVLEDKTELLALLNDAIAALQANGTLDTLIEDYIDGASPNNEATPVTIPVIEGAETIRVVVTGDLPPIDYDTAEGKPAGFNVAMLSAISEHAGVNIELISIDSGARVMALTSGRADAVFWMRSMVDPDGTIVATIDLPSGMALTDHYYTDTFSEVVKK